MDFERAKQAQTYIHQQTAILVEEAYHNDKAIERQKKTIEGLQKQIEILAEHPTEVQFRGLLDKIDDLQAQVYKHREYGRLKDAAKMKVEEKWRSAEIQVERLLQATQDVDILRHEVTRLKELNETQAIAYQALERTIVMNKSTAGYIKDQIYNLETEQSLKKKIQGLDLALEDAMQSGAEFQRLYLAEVQKTKRVLDAANGVHDTW